MRRYSIQTAFLVPMAATLLLAGCGARSREAAWYVSESGCLRHDQCGRAQLCIAGECVSEANDGAFAIGAEAWVGQACRWDDECGAAFCEDAVCVAPQDTDRERPLFSLFRYDDGSCNTHSDCDEWFCVSGYCNAPGTIGPLGAMPSEETTSGNGQPCVADSECAEGQDCRYPGYCNDAILDQPMLFSELPWDPTAAGYRDSSCNYDNDCDQRSCHAGWCVPAEMAGLPLPARGDLEYYDGSCSSDLDCGGWTCLNQWCRSSERLGVFQGAPADNSQAARAYTEGVLDEAGAASAQWVADDAALHGLDVYPAPAGHADDDKWGYGTLSTGAILSSSSGISSSIGLSGLGGLGTSGGLGSFGSGFGSTAAYCGSNDDCPAGDACVYPGECRAGAASETYTTANIAFSATPGDSCVGDDDCGPMLCRNSVCTPVETVETTMPLRGEIHWHDGSCYTDAECGPWSCVGLWCRP